MLNIYIYIICQKVLNIANLTKSTFTLVKILNNRHLLFFHENNLVCPV